MQTATIHTTSVYVTVLAPNITLSKNPRFANEFYKSLSESVSFKFSGGWEVGGDMPYRGGRGD